MVQADVELRDGRTRRVKAKDFPALLHKLDRLHQRDGVRNFTAIEGKRACPPEAARPKEDTYTCSKTSSIWRG